jgi:hypothetical protein
MEGDGRQEVMAAGFSALPVDGRQMEKAVQL